MRVRRGVEGEGGGGGDHELDAEWVEEVAVL